MARERTPLSCERLRYPTMNMVAISTRPLRGPPTCTFLLARVDQDGQCCTSTLVKWDAKSLMPCICDLSHSGLRCTSPTLTLRARSGCESVCNQQAAVRPDLAARLYRDSLCGNLLDVRPPRCRSLSDIVVAEAAVSHSTSSSSDHQRWSQILGTIVSVQEALYSSRSREP